MPTVSLPGISSNTQSIDEIADAIQRQTKELEYLLQNLDSLNITSLTADKIAAGTIDAKVINVTNLTVGDNVQMGPNASITWGQVTGAPSIPSKPSDIGAQGAITQSTTAPSNPSIGAFWLDTNVNLIKVWNGTTWQLTSYTTASQVGAQGTITQSTTAPSSPYTGQMWVDTSVTPNLLKVWNGSAWQKTAPTTPSEINAVMNTQTAVFNALTNNGALPGLYMSGGQLYINASYINTGYISASIINGGTISGVSINVTTDLYVGNNIYLGSSSSGVMKQIRFNNQAVITGEANGSDMTISAQNINLSDGNLFVGSSANTHAYFADFYCDVTFHGNVSGVTAVFG